MDIYLAVTLALEESAPVFIAGIIYYIIARVALMQWWMRDQLDEKARAKGRSWLMSLALSGYLSVAGVYYLYFCASILATGTTFIDFPVDHASSWGSALDTRACACVMLALTTLDLAIGSIDYRQQVGILTGWVHHTVYVGLCVYILYTRQTFVLMVRALPLAHPRAQLTCVEALLHATPARQVFSFCEIPTLMLAVGSLYRPWRTDVAFGVVFFVTRILITTGLFLLVQVRGGGATRAPPRETP